MLNVKVLTCQRFRLSVIQHVGVLVKEVTTPRHGKILLIKEVANLMTP